MAVLVRLIYRSLAALLSWLVLSARSSASKNAELLILRQPHPCWRGQIRRELQPPYRPGWGQIKKAGPSQSAAATWWRGGLDEALNTEFALSLDLQNISGEDQVTLPNLLSKLRSLLETHGFGELCSTIEIRQRLSPYADVRLFFRQQLTTAIAGEFLKAIEACPEVASIRLKAATVSIRLTDEFIRSAGNELKHGVAPSLDAGADETTRLVGFLGANSSKPLHIGHLRNVIVGNALAAAFAAAGLPSQTYSLVGDIGRNVCEAMAGYRLFYNGYSPEDAGWKSDQFVGRCYSAYLTHFQASFPPSNGADPCSREYRPADDLADQLLGSWSNGDSKTMELWRWVCCLVETGHAETLKLLGVNINRRWHESAYVGQALELVKHGLREGIFETRSDSTVVYHTGREEFRTLVLVRSDGFPTEHARIIAVFCGIFADRNRDMVHVDWNGTDWQPAQAILADLMRKLSLIPDRVAHRSMFHGMVILDGIAMSSSSGDPVLIDDLVGRLRASSDVSSLAETAHNAVGENVIADQVLKGFFLRPPAIKPLIFSWPRLLDPDANPGWSIATAWCRASESATHGVSRDGLPADPAYRLAVLQGEAFTQALDQTVTKLDPTHLSRFVIHLAQSYLSIPCTTATAHVARTILGAGLGGLGISTGAETLHT